MAKNLQKLMIHTKPQIQEVQKTLKKKKGREKIKTLSYSNCRRPKIKGKYDEIQRRKSTLLAEEKG